MNRTKIRTIQSRSVTYDWKTSTSVTLHWATAQLFNTHQLKPISYVHTTGKYADEVQTHTNLGTKLNQLLIVKVLIG